MHLLSVRDLTRQWVDDLFRLTADLKTRQKARDLSTPLAGRVLALVFEKPSLRTRVTFEVGMAQLGGRAVYLSPQEIQMGVRESADDVARNLGRLVDAIAARTYRHETIERMARVACVPVINALSDLEHPCQALADFFTLLERGFDLERLRLAWIGDGNNVCHSILLLAALTGVEVSVACPPGYEPDRSVQMVARTLGGRFLITQDPRAAAEGADVLYTDVWTSMGREVERAARFEAFHRYQVNEHLLEVAKPTAVVMHCLPAHRGEEITDRVLDGPRSVVLDQSENRLHVQKAVLLTLLGNSLENH
jgi:ornithine carbamoyltransferase